MKESGRMPVKLPPRVRAALEQAFPDEQGPFHCVGQLKVRGPGGRAAQPRVLGMAAMVNFVGTPRGIYIIDNVNLGVSLWAWDSVHRLETHKGLIGARLSLTFGDNETVTVSTSRRGMWAIETLATLYKRWELPPERV